MIQGAEEKREAPGYGPGRLGRTVKLLANYFVVECQLREALQYNVQIKQLFVGMCIVRDISLLIHYQSYNMHVADIMSNENCRRCGNCQGR